MQVVTSSRDLATYACHAERTRGRRLVEAQAPTRDDFQRDRDRIVHSTAFRRLVYKTQVFLNHEGDLFRTRMTHSLEVAQLGRSLARALRLNEDLVETIALAHDLGHTPFGHAGQDALHECMAPYGGFEHNLQSLRVVDVLEERYPHFDGLNLCFESREGILKHCSLANARLIEAQEPVADGNRGGVAARFLTGQQPSLEAQLCDLADQIAYNAHDIDDGVRSGLLTIDQLREVPLFRRFHEAALRDAPQLALSSSQRRCLYETVRLMLSEQVYDVIRSVNGRLSEFAPQNVDEVRLSPRIVVFGPEMREQTKAMKSFLFANLYRHPQVIASREGAKAMLRELFDIYSAEPGEMQSGYAAKANALVAGDPSSPSKLRRIVADYVSGMTDRFASREYSRLTGKPGMAG
ncbi:deoxyguanosinetriphosphate triphosphohydrolase [Curvibacter sp. APW13]|uniref:deoxyguanosinetriphosphate triphosphohydrolase n=1 Tax=Curvibacter sp. APW13 TaxID=3077236 RepID=UPI0028DE9D22|nr:deoxyguanosinetriphosphate triphosphohydrolase [Curvibacter sp. APW13]MDT8989584.1 deoxyguanosinetriphosphate triphosphohydrolase [Curvibacter sp. APW13]